MTPHQILRATAHRPWPPPRGPWIMRQTWNDLLFAHWPLAPEQLAGKIPAPLQLDLFEGRAWLAVTPFWMSGIRSRFLPPFPGLNAFPEMNVRTYVTCRGRPGVYFFSLDAASRVAVQAARWSFRLPYFSARMNVQPKGEAIFYSSQRNQVTYAPKIPAEFRAEYAPISPPQLRSTGSLEHFLTERYCLYTVSQGRAFRAEIHHLPWPLQDARAEIERNTVARAAGIELAGPPPVLHFAKRLEVLIWPLRPVSGE